MAAQRDLYARLVASAFAAAIAALSPSRAHAVTFTDVTAAAGITHVHTTTPMNSMPGQAFFAGGAAAGDFDGDGRVDLVFTRLNDTPILYRNLGAGTFEPRTSTAGFTTASRTAGVASGDVDNDGDLDLYFTTMHERRNYFYLNDGHGVFTPVGLSEVASLSTTFNHYGHGVSFGDYDNDGYLDVVTGEWGVDATLSHSRLLRNLGGAQAGTFQDVTAAAGLDVYRNELSFRYAPQFVDADRDGRIDIAFAADFKTSQLFWNDGDGTFTDGTIPAGLGTDDNGMGSSWADYDGDGDLDWFITNIGHNEQAPVFGGWNKLYRNDGNRTFTDVTQAAGVRESGWGWGTSFFDYDNDGDYDLAATNGYNGPNWSTDHTVLWQNNGDGTFADVSLAVGINDSQQGRGLLHFDYDEDGDLDLLVVNNGDARPILYRNDGGNAGNYLRIATEGTHSNRDGIGAFITVTPDLDDPDRRMVWAIDGGSSFLSQNERTAHFGLGAAESVDMVTIDWPSGTFQRLFDVTANQVLSVVEPLVWYEADFDGDGDVDGDDLAKWHAVCGENGGADANRDGASDGHDLLVWQRQLGSGVSAATPSASAIPEPASPLLAILAAAAAGRRVRSRTGGAP